MGDFLIVHPARGDAAASRRAEDLADEARTHGWRIEPLKARTWLGARGPTPPRPLVVGPWTLIGDVFDRRSPVLPVTAPGDPWAYERKMMARFWGRYVGVTFASDGQISGLLRDPSGALECVTWAQDGLTLVASAAEDWLIRRLRPPWRINVERLASALRDPVPATGPLLLDGPIALEPGTVQPLLPSRPADILWRPTAFARRSLERPPTIDRAARSLRDAIDEAVTGLASLPGPLAAEVSGGLDSSLVAASLARGGAGSVRLWINAHGPTPEADERTYVQALADALGFAPDFIPHPTGPLTPAGLQESSQGFRPGLAALDRAHDLAWAARIGAVGATAVFTGKGGDSILLQRATPDVFADLWKARGWRALLHTDVLELAAANETSVWSMVAAARRHLRRGTVWPVRDHPLLTPIDSPSTVHPWLEDCEAFGPGKALQIAGVADSVSRHGPSMLTKTIDIRHPLCAQPVIETCLALPTSVLTTGGRDRGLARIAFRDRLPRQILDRRSKGDMTSIYGRMILDNLPVLRSWLLDGRLAALGVIDRTVAEEHLTHETLLWQGRYSTLFVAAAYEGWIRAWEDRLGPAARRLPAGRTPP
ncbi:asparagine synthase C-terminal domain-containing protein [Brevundimonas sp.]|uniref:asparagine synthase C-terminal domain-containing protein n=1 Tax=Brevundimonas sp. TaxID=1871086 RepID=UPI00286D2B5F|nr:asparagine synthase C-terminal domain-containing protein [Brevundimonas sp.]